MAGYTVAYIAVSIVVIMAVSIQFIRFLYLFHLLTFISLPINTSPGQSSIFRMFPLPSVFSPSSTTHSIPFAIHYSIHLSFPHPTRIPLPPHPPITPCAFILPSVHSFPIPFLLRVHYFIPHIPPYFRPLSIQNFLFRSAFVAFCLEPQFFLRHANPSMLTALRNVDQR